MDRLLGFCGNTLSEDRVMDSNDFERERGEGVGVGWGGQDWLGVGDHTLISVEQGEDAHAYLLLLRRREPGRAAGLHRWQTIKITGTP